MVKVNVYGDESDVLSKAVAQSLEVLRLNSGSHCWLDVEKCFDGRVEITMHSADEMVRFSGVRGEDVPMLVEVNAERSTVSCKWFGAKVDGTGLYVETLDDEIRRLTALKFDSEAVVDVVEKALKELLETIEESEAAVEQTTDDEAQESDEMEEEA